jgi:hypothetical protein
MVISRLRARYKRATHGPKMEGASNQLFVDHILWECIEAEDQRTNMDMKKEQWNNGKKVM